MPKLTRKNTCSLADFQRDSDEFIQRLRETGKPLVLTIDGKKNLVVLDADAYVRLMQHVDHLETIKAIAEGLRDVNEGRGRPAEEVFEEIRKKYNLPKDT